MSWTHLDTRKVTARKSHQCEWCFTAIEVGERHLVVEGVGDRFTRYRLHLECDAPVQDSCERSWDEEFTPGAGFRGLTEDETEEVREALRGLEDFLTMTPEDWRAIRGAAGPSSAATVRGTTC